MTFKEAMSRFPSGVVIATTRDAHGKSWGFTASSFSSVSLEPPLILICLSQAADCHQVFRSVPWFAVNILSAADEPIAATFARRGADKFAHSSFDLDEHGSPLLPSAVATMTCEKFDAYDCGDHSVIVGRVSVARLGPDNDPMVYSGRAFGRFAVAAERNALTPLQALAVLPDRAASGNRGAAEDEAVRFCFRCGCEISLDVPQGDTLRRPICQRCGNVHYINPTVVVGCIAQAGDGKVLMCRRQITPRRGYWTFPAGFLECGESAEEGARREAFEEARAQVRIDGLLCIIDVPQISEVHLIFHGALTGSGLAATAESSEVALVAEADVPWESLAFTSIRESLRRYFDDRRQGRMRVHRIDLRTAPESENRDFAAQTRLHAPTT